MLFVVFPGVRLDWETAGEYNETALERPGGRGPYQRNGGDPAIEIGKGAAGSVMLFTSLEFLLAFFPVVLAGYYLLPHRFRNYWLLFASLFFYAWGEPEFVYNMVFTILWSYLMALRIEELPGGSAGKRFMLAVALGVDLGQLFLFKYMNFTIRVLHQTFPEATAGIAQTSYVLPIGISFFTFQAMSYVIDVYRGVPAQKNLGYLGLYISFFPQLIAGPIVRYTTVMEQMDRRTVTPDSFAAGMKRFVIGFNKKVLLANLLAQAADTAFAAESLTAGMAWLGAVAYTLQIFFDFCGYSEMAIGLGLMFGFRFLENFDYPYISKTVTEFWRRWHISLGMWFRDYLYFPLGGSRVGSRARLVFNLAVVWLATGIWHGANWTFLCWGLLHGGVVILEKLFSVPRRAEESGGFRAGYRGFTLLVVVCGWVLFRAETLPAGAAYLKAMFTLSGGLAGDAFWFQLREHGWDLTLGLVCSAPVFPKLRQLLVRRGAGMENVCDAVSGAAQFVLFVISVSFLVMDAHNPFIYFNF